MNKVFISHSLKDKELAKQLAVKLESYKLFAFLAEFDMGYGFNFERVFNELDAGDFWVILFSKYSISEQSSNKDFNLKEKKQLHSRNISIIPILVSGLNVPIEFRDRKVFNIKKNPEQELDKVARYLRNVPRVNFNALTPQDFEKLVMALLEKLRFKNLVYTDTHLDSGYDFNAISIYKDPFGNQHEINWLIEVKFYKESRADILALSQLSSYLIDRPPNYNGVLITNGQLTSAAKNWLQENENSKRTTITVVDGVQLRELLLKYEDLVEDFFGLQG